MTKAKISDTIMSYVKSGYYCIVSCGAHTSYIGRKESLAAGEAVLLDSFYSRSNKWRGTYGNVIDYKDYTANQFTNLRVYKVSSPAKKNTVIKLILEPQSSESNQYIYEK